MHLISRLTLLLTASAFVLYGTTSGRELGPEPATLDVRDERAGFEAADSGLGNPEDTRDWNSSPAASGERRGTGDRFVPGLLKPD